MAVYELHIEQNKPEDDSSLVLVKFPAMQSQFNRPAREISLGIKQKSLKMKLEVDLNHNAASFCLQRAQALARMSAPKNSTTPALLDKNIYNSSTESIDDKQLFAAKLVNNKLVCKPVTHVMIMRSDFSHFDLKEEVDPKEEVKPISVKFAAPDRQYNYARAQQNQQEQEDALDEYRPLAFRSIDSEEAKREREILFGTPLPKVKPDPDAGPGEDRKPPVPLRPDIKPKVEKMDVDQMYACDSEVESIPRKSVQTKNRVKECLIKAKIVSLEEVHQYVRGYFTLNANQQIDLGNDEEINNKDILDALNEYALLVQGNWAVKSEVLYNLVPDGKDKTTNSSNSTNQQAQHSSTIDGNRHHIQTRTEFTGISMSLFTAARDYLLWLFTQNRIVDRLEYTQSVRMPDHDIIELFNQLASFRRDIKKWELKLPTDERFIEQFPDIVQRQTTLWKVKRANKLSIFNG